MWVRVVLIMFSIKIMWCAHEKIPYMEYQRASVDYNDPGFLDNITFMARRYNRKNPLYYMTLHGTLMKPLDNSYTVHIYVYPLMTIGYQRSILEMHSKWCDFVDEKDIFVKVLRTTQFKKFLECPLSAGRYAVTNMTTSYGQYLKAFPFTQGRLVWNMTDYKNKLVLGCHVDMEIKEMSASQLYKLMQ